MRKKKKRVFFFLNRQVFCHYCVAFTIHRSYLLLLLLLLVLLLKRAMGSTELRWWWTFKPGSLTWKLGRKSYVCLVVKASSGKQQICEHTKTGNPFVSFHIICIFHNQSNSSVLLATRLDKMTSRKSSFLYGFDVFLLAHSPTIPSCLLSFR